MAKREQPTKLKLKYNKSPWIYAPNADITEKIKPRAKTFGKIALIIRAELDWSKTLNIVGEIIAEKKRSMPNNAEFIIRIIVFPSNFEFICTRHVVLFLFFKEKFLFN